MKHALTSSPLIFPPDFDSDLILYISASTHLVAGVLIQEDDNGIEHVIYYVSKNLVGPHVSYSHEDISTGCRVLGPETSSLHPHAFHQGRD